MLNLNTKFILKSFRIFRLFGKNNVNIDFEDNIKIFVGENGIGKTTILNVLYYTIKLKLSKLRDIQFETIELEFSSGEKIYLKREWLLEDSTFEIDRSFFNRIKKYISVREYHRIRDCWESGDVISFNELLSDLEFRHVLPIGVLNDFVVQFHSERNNNNHKKSKSHKKYLEEFKKKIGLYVNEEILYFPTYRRIEEDLKKIGSNIYNDNVVNMKSSEIIQFGMNDVQLVFNNIEEEIKNSTLKGYSRVTGEMITQLVHNQNVTARMKDKIRDTETVNIILDRVGTNLSSNDRERIKELINSNELFKDEQHTYDPLIFFLCNLIEIYELHSMKEDSIKTFSKVCNSYLVNKEVTYNQSTVKISIVDKKTQKSLELKNLSSGEKQIVSLFTRIFLTAEENFIVLFDEPELSLSIEWQEKLLPDIIYSGKCVFLFTVTHSPFIYRNELKEYAQSMELFIEEDSSNE